MATATGVRMSRLATLYVKVPIAGTVNGTAVDVTADVAKLAFPAAGALPGDGDWLTAEWETDGDVTLARVLVGPDGDATLPPAKYDVWAKVVDTPEIPVGKAGTLTIT